MTTSDALETPVASPLPSGLLAALPPHTAESAAQEAVRRWWNETSSPVRTALLGSDAGTPLPRSVAAELARRGVSCPLTLVAEHGRLVRRALAPAPLVDLLTQERSAWVKPSPQSAL